MNLRSQNNTTPVNRGLSDVIRTNPSVASPRTTKKLRKIPKIYLIITGVLVVLTISTSAWYLYAQNVTRDIQTNGYQAVFLDNGQVYFGKLSRIGSDYFRLTDVYYFESNNTAQTATTSATANVAPNLIKLGKEIHSPQDKMDINKDKILFFENISQDGAVGKAIQNNKNK